MPCSGMLTGYHCCVDTEKNYVEALQMIVTRFIRALEQNILKPEQMAAIFMNIEVSMS